MMIGREHELRRLVQLVQARRPEVAVIAGEPGIGKTRLVAELLANLPAGTVALVGHAEPGSLSRPYEVLLDALHGLDGAADDAPGGPDDTELDALTDPDRSPVERLHTGLSVLGGVIGERPAVVVFEDLHWADSESAALFERIAEQGGPRLLIGTYRPDEVSSRQPLSALLARMERRHRVHHVRLERLSQAETAALLAAATGRPAPARAAMALHQRTGGNPFFLEELLRGWHGDDLDELCDQPLPWNLAEVLRRHTDDLDPASQRVLEAAAVLGHKIPFDLLATVTAVAEDELIAVLRDLVTRGIVIESGEDEFTFRHALVRESITGQMLGRQRRRLHEAALEALLAAGTGDPAGRGGPPHDPAMIAHHARAAGRYDDMVAAARRGAALYLSIGSAYQAMELADMALDEVGDDTELLGLAAQAAWLASLLDDAARYAHRWRDAATTPTDRAAATYQLMRLAWEADELDEMRTLTKEIESLIGQLPVGADQAEAMAAVAHSAMLRDDLEACLLWSDRALALADEFDLPRVRLAALVEKGSALIERSSSAYHGRDILAGVVDEAERRGEWVLAARALHNLVHDLPPTSQTEQAQMLERMRVNAERGGFEKLAVAAYFQGRARVEMHAGNLTAAIEALRTGRDRDRGYLRRGRRLDYHGVFLAGLYLEAGELDRADEIITDLRAQPQVWPLTVPGLAFHVACRRGDRATAEAELEAVLEAVADQAWRSGAQAHDLVSAALAVGLPLDRVDRMAHDLLDESVWDDFRTLVDAQLAEAHGRLAPALVAYRSVTTSEVFSPPVRGSAHLGAARCLLALDQRDAVPEATAEVRAAGALLARWGGWRVAQLDAARERLGLASPAGRGVTGAAALTPRELEVALLIADGLTNGELARRLFISPKTAAVHVSSILRKLGVSSRTEVAAQVRG
jgi:DNA-binding NarL/FixJ family response regulator